jgi:hypothetical protein
MGLEDIGPVFDAFEQYRTHYDNGGSDYSVSELISPPRITLLQKRHWREILAKPLFIVDHIDSFDGTSMHNMFESLLKQNPKYICERRLWDKVLDRKISGCPDVVSPAEKILYDFKRTSVWKKMFGDTKKWEEQLNLYCYLLAASNRPPIEIERITVIAWWKDWQAKDRQCFADYPKEKIEPIDIPLWDFWDQEKFLYDAIKLLKDNELLPDELLPECHAADMWVKDHSFAVYAEKDGKKERKARRVLNTMEAATKYCDEKTPPDGMHWVIIERPGVRMRCENYCDVKDWCNTFKTYMEGKQ